MDLKAYAAWIAPILQVTFTQTLAKFWHLAKWLGSLFKNVIVVCNYEDRINQWGVQNSKLVAGSLQNSNGVKGRRRTLTS